MRYLLLALSIVFSFITSAQVNFIKDSLDTYIQKGMHDWQVPGLAIVIVKDGQVVVMKGYGVKDIKTRQPVDENTLFMIASNTKLFTGTALAHLETRGKISLNDKIISFYPNYKLFNDTITKMVSVRDMLTHRIGTKTYQGDFTFWNTSLSRAEIMKRMRYLEPPQIFRQSYGYCNSCYLTAGEVIPKVTGQSWEDYIQDSIIDPLEMNATRMLSTGIEKQPNVATPYTTSYSNTLVQVPYDNWNNLAPAASMISNVKDLSKWLFMQLDSGRYQGKSILPWATLQKTRDIQIISNSRKSAIFPTHFRGYGLGVNVGDYNGRQVYWHTGGAGGMVSNVCFIPEENLGIAILTNNDNQSFYELLRYQVMDAYLSVPYVNRSNQQLTGFRKNMDEQISEINAWRKRVKGNKPVLALSAYEGNYSNRLNGEITINKINDHLVIKFHTKPDLEARLDYMDNNEWLMTYNNIEYGIHSIRFDLENGKVKSITTKQNNFIEYDPYVFVKQ